MAAKMSILAFRPVDGDSVFLRKFGVYLHMSPSKHGLGELFLGNTMTYKRYLTITSKKKIVQTTKQISNNIHKLWNCRIVFCIFVFYTVGDYDPV
jgi:hypothetical protein